MDDSALSESWPSLPVERYPQESDPGACSGLGAVFIPTENKGEERLSETLTDTQINIINWPEPIQLSAHRRTNQPIVYMVEMVRN